jgi:Mn-dependent DtxR family transcriptional regulator
LFLAIGYSNDKGPSSLARVIGAADAIQHSVLTWEEVDGGLFRLGKAGYVTVRDEKVSLTQQGRLILEGLREKMVHKRQDELSIAIGASPWTAHDPAVAREHDQPQIIDQRVYQAAVSQYTKHPGRTLDGE